MWSRLCHEFKYSLLVYISLIDSAKTLRILRYSYFSLLLHLFTIYNYLFTGTINRPSFLISRLHLLPSAVYSFFLIFSFLTCLYACIYFLSFWLTYVSSNYIISYILFTISEFIHDTLDRLRSFILCSFVYWYFKSTDLCLFLCYIIIIIYLYMCLCAGQMFSCIVYPDCFVNVFMSLSLSCFFVRLLSLLFFLSPQSPHSYLLLLCLSIFFDEVDLLSIDFIKNKTFCLVAFLSILPFS